MAQEAAGMHGWKTSPDTARDPPPMLAGFIKYLEEAGLMRLYLEGDDEDAVFDNEVRVQALVMLANRFGLGAPYECDRYVFGPSSDPLAEDCITLSRNRGSMYDGVTAAVPGSFRRDDFENLVRGKSRDWLVAASKMAQLRAYRDTREDLVDSVRDDDIAGRKPTYPKEYASGILCELEDAGLVTRYR